jgi:choline dehydrogenase-like flavoprotein
MEAGTPTGPQHYDYLIVGSGAGGAAVAHGLASAGARVLLLEKGPRLPRDGSTLDVRAVLIEERFKNRETWLDGEDRPVIPGDFFNLGGKTKWYGAALLRFSPEEFEADPGNGYLGWPIRYEDLAPYYDEAERLLGVRRFAPEPAMARLAARLVKPGGPWEARAMPLGLAPDAQAHRNEAARFDGFASVRGIKADAEVRLLDPLRAMQNLRIETGAAVAALLPRDDDPRAVIGVALADGRRFHAVRVVLAAGALHTPRLLEEYLARTGLAAQLPGARFVGRYYKHHLNTILLAFGLRRNDDLLFKTLLFRHRGFPHSSVQGLGGRLAEEIIATRLPRFLPDTARRALSARACGFFLTTEDSSHPDNRVAAHAAPAAAPLLDYRRDRMPRAWAEHAGFVRAFHRALAARGLPGVYLHMPPGATAHACGSCVAGRDPQRSVVDGYGRVHGLENLYIADGSVLPRSSRANPALTIYAWALRLAHHLRTRGATREHETAATHPVRS